MGAFATLFQDPGLAGFYKSGIAPLTDPIDAGFAREWQQSTLARPMAADHLDIVVAETLKVPARVWREAFDGFLKTPDFTSELTQITAPSLIMWGDRDTYTLRAGQERLLAAIPGARLLVYEGAGHAFHWEAPGQFTRDLVSFLWEERSDPFRFFFDTVATERKDLRRAEMVFGRPPDRR
jgi:non-heme chloroperoxidase